MPERFTIYAESSGLCPLCGRWIAKGRSRIAALAVGQPPSLDAVEYSPRLGWHVIGSERSTSIRARTWCHADCITRWLAAHTFDEQDRIAADRRAELRAHRLAVLAHHIDGARVQRRQARRNP